MRRWVYIAVLAAPLPVIAQDSDERGFVEALLEDSLSDVGRVVDIQGFSGALSSTASIETLTIADETGIWLTLKGVTLNWNRAALLSGHLDVTELSAERLLIPRRPIPVASMPSAQATPLALPDLPVSIDISKLEIGQAELGASVLGQQATISLTGAAALIDGSAQTNMSIVRLAPRSGELSLTASYSNSTQDLMLDLSLAEPRDGLVAQMLNLPGAPAVSVTANGAGPLSDFTAKLALSTDGTPRLTGAFTLSRPEDTTHFTADLGGDIAPLFAPEYQSFFGPNMALSASGSRAADGHVKLDALSLEAEALAISGQLELTPEGWPTLVQLRAKLASDNTDSVILPIAGPKTQLGSARVALSYDTRKSDSWLLDADLSGLNRPDMALSTARFRADGTLTPPGLTAGRIEGAITSNLTGLSFSDMALTSALGSALRGALNFTWEPGAPVAFRAIAIEGQHYDLTGSVDIANLPGAAEIQIETKTQLASSDLSRFAALAGQPLSGAAALSIQGNIQPISGAFDLAVSGDTRSLALGDPMLDPLLEGDGQLHLDAQRNTTGTTLRTLQVSTSHAEITAEATLLEQNATAMLDAKINDLQRVFPDISGTFTLQTNLTRTGENWTIMAKASAPGETSADLDLHATGMEWATLRSSGSLRLETQLLSTYAGVLGQPVSGAVALTLTGSGHPAEQSFDAQLDMTGQDLATGLAQLDQLLRNKTTAQLSATRDAEGLLSLSSARIVSPEIDLSASSPDGDTVAFKATLRDLGLVADGLEGPARASGTATLENRNWRIRADGSGPGNSDLKADGTIARDGATMDMALSGVAPLALANTMIRPRSLSGLLRYDLRISGPPALSSVQGVISAQNARATLPGQNLALEEINADIALQAARAMLSVGARASSGGTLQVTGPIGLTAPFDAALETTLTDVILTDPQLFETTLNGSILMNGPLTGGARISGRLTMGQTELRVPNPTGAEHSDLPGLRHVNEPALVKKTRKNAGLIQTGPSAAATGPEYAVDIQVAAPDRIFVRGRGLDAELGGALRLTGSTQNVVPQGRFDLIRGRLDILGKRLSLDEGLIQLQGAFDPFIRFVASTETTDTTANIVIEGQASAPKLTFTSSPELPQDEVLALILFGKELSTISPLQAVRLAAAIRTLAGKGGDGLGGSIRKGLALDDLDVTTTDEGATEARAGKYLSENIYSEVTADSEGNSQINLNLSINRSVTARGRLNSDGETGIGIFIEKDY